MTTMGAMRHRPVLVFVLLAGVLFEGTLAMQFSTAFAASVFAGVEEILTVPWYQGIDQVVAGFGSKWAVLEDARAGGITNVNMNNTFSYIWSLYKPFNAREISLDFLYVGLKNGAFLGYGLSTSGLDTPEAWWQPDRNYTCNFTTTYPYGTTTTGYWIKPDKSVDWRQRTKAQSGCMRTYDQHTDADSGNFHHPTYAFAYDPTVRPWYIQALATGAGWTDPYVFAGNGMVGITATAPLYNSDGSHILGAVAADYELGTLATLLEAAVSGSEDQFTLFIVDADGFMIAASVAGITSVNDVRVKANMTSDAIVAASASTILEKHGSWSAASGIETTVSVPSGDGLYWALSTELTETHGLTWHVVVAERVDCDKGYFQYEHVKTGSVCSKCPDGKNCLGLNHLPYPKSGYFSPLEDIYDDAVECFVERNCPGGDTANGRECFDSLKGNNNCTNRAKENDDDVGSEFVCRKGSTGMLCETCEDDYYYSTDEGCLHCSGSFIGLVVICSVWAVICLIGFYVYRKHGDYIGANFPLIIAAVCDTGRMKVVFANSQIIGSIAWSTGVSWPPPFSYFAKAFSIFELNIFDILPLGCIGGLNFYGYVFVQSLCPVILVVLLHIFLRDDKDRVIPNPIGQHSSLVVLTKNADSAKGWSLLVLYIFLPAANLALVRIFKCYDMPDGTSWLTADMSLQCTHKGGAMLTNHALMVTYASAALIFWGPAVIYLFWRLLVNHHDMIVNYDKEQDTMECPPEIAPYKFLFFHYRPERYSAESKECLRRIALMGGVALMSTTGHGNGAENALCGMVLSLGFSIWQRERNPWDNPATNALANSFSWVVFFVFFGAYVVITSEDQDQGIFNPHVVSWLLIILSFTIMGLALEQQYADFGKNRELLKLKGQIADFREQVVGIAFAKRTMRGFERQRFLTGDWSMKASDLTFEQRQNMIRLQKGISSRDIQDEEEHDNVFEYFQEASRAGKRYCWYWQEDSHKESNYTAEQMHPDTELRSQGRIWVEYKIVIMAKLDAAYKRYLKDVQSGLSPNPVIRLDLEGRVVKGATGGNGFIYNIDLQRNVQINEKSGYERPWMRIEKDFEPEVEAPATDKIPADRNIDLIDINDFTNKDGPGTAVTFNAERLDAREITEADIPAFPFDLIEAEEPVLLLQKGQLIQIQKKRDDGWMYGFVVWEPEELSEGKGDDRPTRVLAKKSKMKRDQEDLTDMILTDMNNALEQGAPADDVEWNFMAEAEAKKQSEEDLAGESSGWFPSIFVRPPQMQELKEMQDAMGGQKEAVDALAPPDSWSDDAKQGKAYNAKLINLQEGGGEYEGIKENFKKRMGSRKSGIRQIVNIQRIENLALWQSYAAKKASMVHRAANEGLDSSLYEKEMMYHGTHPEVIPKIVQQGFNRGFAGRNAVRFGKGVYFALTSAYSNNYAEADSRGVRHMFVCRVMVGETSQGQNEQLVPEVRVQATQQQYDSTTDQIDAPEPSDQDPGRYGSGVRQMYVTYHDAQAYPEYLIQYKYR